MLVLLFLEILVVQIVDLSMTPIQSQRSGNEREHIFWNCSSQKYFLQKMSRSPKDVKKVSTICHVPKDVTIFSDKLLFNINVYIK